MPYIKQTDRVQFREFLKAMPYIQNEGHLNYVITKIILDYLGNHDHCYATMNSVIGVLQCVSHELYRRILTPYEEEKLKTNGDLHEVEEV